MLKHTAIGPSPDGMYFAAYRTPGATSMTAAASCRTRAQAVDESDRLNQAQLRREEMIRRERMACGLPGVYPDLKGVN